MKLYVNGQLTEPKTATTVQALIAELQTKDCAVAVNETFVPRHQYAATELHDGDRIELVQPMQGG